MILEVPIILSLTIKGGEQLRCRCLKIRLFKTGELTTHILSSCLSQSPYHQHKATSNLLLADAEVAASPPAPHAGGDVIRVTPHSLLYANTPRKVSACRALCVQYSPLLLNLLVLAKDIQRGLPWLGLANS